MSNRRTQSSQHQAWSTVDSTGGRPPFHHISKSVRMAGEWRKLCDETDALREGMRTQRRLGGRLDPATREELTAAALSLLQLLENFVSKKLQQRAQAIDSGHEADALSTAIFEERYQIFQDSWLRFRDATDAEAVAAAAAEDAAAAEAADLEARARVREQQREAEAQRQRLETMAKEHAWLKARMDAEAAQAAAAQAAREMALEEAKRVAVAEAQSRIEAEAEARAKAVAAEEVRVAKAAAAVELAKKDEEVKRHQQRAAKANEEAAKLKREQTLKRRREEAEEAEAGGARDSHARDIGRNAAAAVPREAAPAPMPTAFSQAVDGAAEEVVGADQQHQKHRKEQMRRFTMEVEKKLLQVYGAPSGGHKEMGKLVGHVNQQLMRSRDKRDQLRASLNTLLRWRNICSHAAAPGLEDAHRLPSDDEMLGVMQTVTEELGLGETAAATEGSHTAPAQPPSTAHHPIPPHHLAPPPPLPQYRNGAPPPNSSRIVSSCSSSSSRGGGRVASTSEAQHGGRRR